MPNDPKPRAIVVLEKPGGPQGGGMQVEIGREIADRQSPAGVGFPGGPDPFSRIRVERTAGPMHPYPVFCALPLQGA